MNTPETSFNPVDYASLGDSIASTFLHQPLEPLNAVRRVIGSGIYAFYYNGSHPTYKPLARNFRSSSEFLKVPIYVGKAMPQSNKGLPLMESEARVFERIRKHSADYEKVGLAQNLYVRYLVLSPVWVVLAETHLIRMFQPLWNRVVQGKGSNAQGGNRNSEPSDWDVLHPGRGRDAASRLSAARAARAKDVTRQVEEHLSAYFTTQYPALKARLGIGFVMPEPTPLPMGEPPSPQ